MYPKRLILDEARQMGIALAPLDVNKSQSAYIVEKIEQGDAIRIALSTVGGISEKEIASIVQGRPYVDLADFFKRSGASIPVTESLILTGGFDQLHPVNHRDLLLHLSDLQKTSSPNIAGSQMTLGFAPPQLIASGLPEVTKAEKVRHEIERLGMDVSHHMLEFYAPFLNAIGAVKSSQLLEQRSGAQVLIAGVKVALQTPPIRSGKRVIFLSIDDGYGCSDATFFTDTHERFASTLYSSSLFLVRGHTRRTGERGISVRATGAWDLQSAYRSWKESTSSESNVAI
jgi:error-prone DNA polymerase